MKFPFFIILILWVALDVAGCSPKPREHNAPPMSQERTFEVEGEITHLDFRDISKTSKSQNFHTYLTFKVLDSKNLSDPELKLDREELSVSRSKKSSDDDFTVGETYTFKIGVDKLENPRYFYWLN